MRELHLVATYIKHPRPGVNASRKNVYGNAENYQYDEKIEFTRGIKSRDLSNAGIILNLNRKSVVKNSHDPAQRDFGALFKYFLEGYPEYVARAMSELDVEYLKQFLPEEQPKDSEVTVAPVAE